MSSALPAVLAAFLSGPAAPDDGAVREVAIALDGVPGGAACPSAAVLARALEARLPGITSVTEDGPGRDLLRLRLDDGGALGLQLALVDEAGQTVLERSLAAGGGKTSSDRTGACAVLAETIALVVERYVRHLEYRAPAAVLDLPATTTARAAPVEPQARASSLARFMLGAGASVVPGRGGRTRTEPELVADLWAHLRAVPLMLSFRAAVSWPVEVAVPSTERGVFRYAALPLRAGIGVPVFRPGQAGFVALAALVGVDLFRAETRDIAIPQRVDGVQPVAEVGVAAALRFGPHLVLRPQLLLGVRPERAFQLRDPALAVSPLFVDSRFSLRAGFDVGFVFGKK